MKSIVSKTLFVFIAILFFSCNSDDHVAAQVLPETFPLQETSLYPEGITYSASTQKTYIGSYYKGKILTLDLDGNMTDFITDETLVAVVGLAVDETNNRLLVCNSDAGISFRSDPSTIGQLAQVIAYNLTTGEKLTTIDLSTLYPGGHFLNDLIKDNNGNFYVTDSFSPVIYKIDENNTPSVLVSDPIFEVPQGTFGLNGIVFHPDNYLIVGKSFGGIIYKVPLNNPSDIQEITLNSEVNSLDGLLLINSNTLALVSNNFTGAPFNETVYKIETSNNWASGNITNSFTELDGIYPTTLAFIETELYVNFGYFPELIDPNSTLHDNFKLQKIEF